MALYTQSARTVEAMQTRWPMTVTVNGKAITGNAGDWLVMPTDEDPYFVSDEEFIAKYIAV